MGKNQKGMGSWNREGKRAFRLRAQLEFPQADEVGVVALALLLAMPRCPLWVLATSPAYLSFAPQGPESVRLSSPLSSCPH